MKILSRNTPIALVVGAAGFIGSHLVEKLLSKDIQVVGVDNLSTGTIDNLLEAGKNKHFHFLNQSAATKIPLNFPRLDYAFFTISLSTSVAEYLQSLNIFLELCEKFNPKVVLASSINLYNTDRGNYSYLKEAEQRLAEYSSEKKDKQESINARIVRFAPIYGPRMNFTEEDPIIDLIYSAAADRLQKELASLDFSTRALYVKDAVNLLIKAVMHGSTARKIYDGALPAPLKVTEIRQILIDPLWYEQKGYQPTELPPWNTPNLEKTLKELSWYPKAEVVPALRETMVYFNEHPVACPKENSERDEKEKESMHKEEVKLVKQEKKTIHPQKRKEWGKGVNKLQSLTTIIIGLALITYALLLPLVKTGWEVGGISRNLTKARESLINNNFNQAREDLKLARSGVLGFKNTTEIFLPVKQAGLLTDQFTEIEQLLKITEKTVDAAFEITQGMEALLNGFQVMTGGKEGEVKAYLKDAEVYLNQADQNLGLVRSLIKQSAWEKISPINSWFDVNLFSEKLATYQSTVNFSRLITRNMTQACPSIGVKKYLILLQDETRLRPGGGVPVAVGEIGCENGQILPVKVESVQNIDKQLGLLEPPVDLKGDIESTAWSLKSSNFEADAPANARLVQWFYSQAEKRNTAGVITLDLEALSRLIKEVGEVDLKQKNERVDGSNLLKMVVETADEEQLLVEVLEAVLNKMLFLQNQNWLNLSLVFQDLFAQKHLFVYFNDPLLFSQMKAEGYTAFMPRQTKDIKGQKEEFLAISEANLEKNHANFYLQRAIELKSSIEGDGKIHHKLKIKYINTSSSDVWPAGKYRARIKLYLASGNSLIGASLAGKDILKEVTSFSDYGRAGYLLFLQVRPQEQQELNLEFENIHPVEFVKDKLSFNFDVIKQPGVGNDPFTFTLAVPETWQAVSADWREGSKEVKFTSDLSTDRTMAVEIQR
ncbi:MAG: DUF4012 domain-containing protein [Armatimonadetes bacterium]|nr:MAG: DUF4012 domain-containing protein [Armatimonadota bacterium]